MDARGRGLIRFAFLPDYTMATALAMVSGSSDAASLYDKLEHVVLPLYAARDGWIKIMKGAISRNASLFHSHRMMRRYAADAYFG